MYFHLKLLLVLIKSELERESYKKNFLQDTQNQAMS